MSIIKTAVPTKAVDKVEVIKPLAEVVQKLTEAVALKDSITNLCKDAALIASKQLNRRAPLKARIDAVTAAYAHLWGGKKGVKKDFCDALTLYACAQPPIMENKKPVQPETNKPISIVAKTGGETVHTNMADAVSMVRTDMQSAAVAAREANGIGRKKSERSPKVPDGSNVKPAVALVVNHENVMRLVASQLDADNKAFVKLLTATLALCGWKLTKAK